MSEVLTKNSTAQPIRLWLGGFFLTHFGLTTPYYDVGTGSGTA